MTQPTPKRGNRGQIATTSTALVGHAQALQSVLTDLSTVTVHQLVTFARRFGQQTDFPQLLLSAVPDIISPHTQAAAAVTAQWYDEISPSARFHASPAGELPAERLEKTVKWALYAPTETEKPPTEVVPQDVMLSRLAGSAKRMVYDASRDTVVANAAAQGVKWARHAQPDACAFCRLLATREDVYSSEKSAVKVVGSRGVAKGSRKLGEKYHDHCRCLAVPIPAGETYVPPAYVADWQQQYLDARRAGNRNTKTILAHMRQADGGDKTGRKDASTDKPAVGASVPPHTP